MKVNSYYMCDVVWNVDLWILLKVFTNSIEEIEWEKYFSNHSFSNLQGNQTYRAIHFFFP